MFVAPSSPPVNFHGHNVSATSIFVSWGDVPKPSANGVLLGYHASCKAVKSSDSYFAEFLPEEHHWELKGLKTFANYSCWLRAYNNYGNGSWSEELVISTDDAGMLPTGSCGHLLMSCKLTTIQKEFRVCMSLVTLCDWSRQIVPSVQQIRFKSMTSCDSIPRACPRLRQFTSVFLCLL